VLLGVGLEGARIDAKVVHHGAGSRVDRVLLEGRHGRGGQDPDDQDGDRELDKAESGLAAGRLTRDG
jgi:hypothetical protein